MAFANVHLLAEWQNCNCFVRINSNKPFLSSSSLSTYHGLTLISAWINNRTHFNVCDEISYPFQTSTVVPFRFEWISNSIPYNNRGDYLSMLVLKLLGITPKQFSTCTCLSYILWIASYNLKHTHVIYSRNMRCIIHLSYFQTYIRHFILLSFRKYQTHWTYRIITLSQWHMIWCDRELL